MSKKFKAQASSSRAASGAFGSSPSPFAAFSKDRGLQTTSSSLSYIAEPLDLSSISQPNVVVAFKNFPKKESKTKEKALSLLKENLFGPQSGSHALEDSILEAWVKTYPRLSIESSRRVRQLAHTVQGLIVSKSGKRIARYIPQVIGAWLAGLYDNDTIVFRAAQESFTEAFPSEEKRQALWKIYQNAILDFVIDATLQQTTLTLSDERSVSPDTAAAKYSRVVATALQVFHRLMSKLSSGDLSKSLEQVETLLGSKSLWSFSYHDDQFVRRSLYELLQVCLTVPGRDLDLKLISSCVISKSLSISQVGSSLSFSNVLLLLTQKHPEVWTTEYSGKASPSKRLYQFIKMGSEWASSRYWDNVCKLIRIIPPGVITGTSGATFTKHAADSLMESIHEAAINRDERPNAVAAWICFIEIATWISMNIEEKEQKEEFLRGQIFPIIKEYITPSTEDTRWKLPQHIALNLIVNSFPSVAKNAGEIMLRDLWQELSDRLVLAINISLPVQSSGYIASQNAIGAQGNTLFSLQSQVLTKVSGNNDLLFINEIFQRSGLYILNASISLLRTRNGNPYGAASVVEKAVNQLPEIISMIQDLQKFLANDIPRLVFSPSGEHLVSVLFACRKEKGFDVGSAKCIEAFAEAAFDGPSQPSLKKLFSVITVSDLQMNKNLTSLIMDNVAAILRGNRNSWDDIVIILRNPATKDGIAKQVIRLVVENVLSGADIFNTLSGLAQIFSHDKEIIRAFAESEYGSKLISRLLYLSESADDEISEVSLSLNRRIQDVTGSEHGINSKLDIVQRNFHEVGPESISVDTLVSIAKEIFDAAQTRGHLQLLLPSRSQWQLALAPFMRIPPLKTEAINNSLKGIVYLVENLTDARPEQVNRDLEGFTSAFRFAFYITKLFLSKDLSALQKADPERLSSLFIYFPLAVHLINCDLNIEESRGMLELDSPEIKAEAADLVADAFKLINSWSATSVPLTDNTESTIHGFWNKKLELLEGKSPEAYYLSETFICVLGEQQFTGIKDAMESHIRTAKELDSDSNPFVLSSVLATYKDQISQSPTGTRLCNDLVSDITELDSDEMSTGIRQLVQLRLLEDGIKNVQERKLVFLVKNLIDCAEEAISYPGFMSEILMTLCLLSPLIKEVFGSHWSSMFSLLKDLWSTPTTTDDFLPVLHASLRLFACLRSLAANEINEEVSEEWKEARITHPPLLVRLLKNFGSVARRDQPRNITADILARQIFISPIDNVEDIIELFASLSTENKGIQHAAFNVLHRAIPESQKVVSVDVALSDTVAKLPAELMALVSVSPSQDLFSGESIDESAWIKLRSYLLGWITIFDHFSNASHQVQEAYVISVKESQCLNNLLVFLFSFLQGQNGKFLDAAKFNIRFFELDCTETDKQEAQWLSIHVYYLCLRFIPNLTKSWWIDSEKRVKGPVEVWTEKYISPSIIVDALKSVSDWASDQDWTGEDQPMEIRVSPKTAEVIASIEVDEESPPISIAIYLPSAFPLQQALVTGRSRVAVDEKKWKVWLLTIQGIMMFSGNLIDGLVAFRRNVQGALKGHTECAICYSIISPAMQTPNKRCATCKNTFHSDCLFKWFRSSNASSCPLCRNPFLYS